MKTYGTQQEAVADQRLPTGRVASFSGCRAFNIFNRAIYRQNEPGKATIGSSLTTNPKMVIEALNFGQAKAMIEAQYGKNSSIHSVRPL